MKIFSGKEVCGIEMDKYLLKLFLCRFKQGHISNVNFGLHEMPTGLLENGKIHEKEKLYEYLTFLKKHYGLEKTPVVARINSNKVVSRYIELPNVSPKKLQSIILHEANKFLPYTTDNAVIDYVSVGLTANNSHKTKGVLLGALPKDIVYDYFNLLQNAGLNLVAIDISPLALQRWLLCLGKFHFPDVHFVNLCIINFEKEITDIIIIKKGIPVFARSLKIYNLNGEILINELIKEIKGSLEYCKTELSLQAISKIILTGSLSENDVIKKICAENFQVPFELGDIDVNNSSYNISAEFAVTAGLSLREV